MKYLIAWPGPLMEKSFPNLESAFAYVEKYAPLKRGWSGQWEPHTDRTNTWRYRRYNSKMKLVKGYDVYLYPGTLAQLRMAGGEHKKKQVVG